MTRTEPKFEAVIFNRAYNVCPYYPEGTRWEVYLRSRYASCCWNMLTFREALAYLRDQHGHAVRDTKSPRSPGDRHCEAEFRGWIDGPGGRLEWATIERLVKGETAR